MKINRIAAIISFAVSVFMFSVSLGFLRGMELETISFKFGAFGAFITIVLWGICLCLANGFYNGGDDL